MIKEDVTTALKILLIGVILIMCLTDCRSVMRNKSIKISDSTIYREYDVPVKIKETTIKQELRLDSLCSVYQSLIEELKRRKEKETTIIYKDGSRGDLTAKIDSLGRLIMMARTDALDTTIKGKETISVKSKEINQSVEKKSNTGLIIIITLVFVVVLYGLVKLLRIYLKRGII